MVRLSLVKIVGVMCFLLLIYSRKEACQSMKLAFFELRGFPIEATHLGQPVEQTIGIKEIKGA